MTLPIDCTVHSPSVVVCVCAWLCVCLCVCMRWSWTEGQLSCPSHTISHCFSHLAIALWHKSGSVSLSTSYCEKVCAHCIYILCIYMLYIISAPMGVLQGNMVAYSILVVCTLQRLSPHTTPVTLWVALSNIILSLF